MPPNLTHNRVILTDEAIRATVADLVKPGKTVHIYSSGFGRCALWHIRSVIDDGIVIYRTWSRRSRQWVYHVEYIEYFRLLYKMGYLE